jgi:hypothetical protein
MDTGAAAAAGYESDIDNEPPILQELGVDFDHMYKKVASVLAPWKPVHQDLAHDADMAGPIVFCLALGMCLLLAGKVHFGYIYGFFALGCVGVYLVMSLMSPAERSLGMAQSFSILGYCLLPLTVLAAASVLLSLQGVAGFLLASVAIAWATVTAARLFEQAMDLSERRWLIAYPIFLLYAVFALITVF